MRTRTIFEAYDRTYRGLDWIIPPKRARQNDKFRAELLRRMDERDTLVEQLASSNDKITDFENEACHQMEMLDG